MSFPSQTDCLNEVFENLEDDKITLRSCLLVNRLWCKTSVRILWRNIWSFKYSVIYDRQLEVASAILSTLVSCLPSESKELLHKNEIFISTSTSKPPLFNYVSFCKVLSINEIGQIVDEGFKNNKSITKLNLKDSDWLVTREIFKMFVNQISSLKMLTYLSYDTYNITFTSFPGVKDCLTDLSELYCSSIVHSEFFYGLSQICHNLRSLTIDLESEVSNGLKELVSSQNNLKYLKLSDYEGNGWADIIPALTKHFNTLISLHLYGGYINYLAPLSFVSSFLNLQEIKFSLSQTQFDDFKQLQYFTFPKLQTLKIPFQYPRLEYLTKFLETNGKNLKEFYVCERDNALKLSIAKYCPNLMKLLVLFNSSNESSDMLKTIFNSCQCLEGMVIVCYFNEKEVLETVAKHSPKNFYELKLQNSKLFSKDLESFFISWKNRTSKKSLKLIIVDNYNRLKAKEENMKMIEKYKNLGVIKKFEIRKYCEEELYL